MNMLETEVSIYKGLVPLPQMLEDRIKIASKENQIVRWIKKFVVSEFN